MKKKAVSEKQMLAALIESTRSVLESSSFKAAALSVYESCKKLIGATAGYVVTLSEDEKHNVPSFFDMGNLTCSLDPNIPMPIRGFVEKAYLSGEIIFQNNFSDSKWLKYIPSGHGRLENVLFAPLMLDGKTVGLMGFANKAGGFSKDDIDIVKPFADLAALGFLTSRAIGDLVERENILRSILTTANDAIITVNERGEVAFWNNAAEKIFGYTADEIIGRPSSRLMPKEFRKLHDKSLSNALKLGKTKFSGRTVELVGLRKNGEMFPIELSLAGWQAGDKNNFTGIVRDITSKEKAQKKLYEQNAEIKSLAKFPDENTNPVLRIRQDGTIMYGNPASLPLLSFFGCEVGGKIADNTFKAIQQALSSPSGRGIQIAYEDKIYFFNIVPISDKKYVNLYGYDITELKQTEKALRENEKLFRTIFETSPDAISINRLADGKFVAVNEGFLELSGFSLDEVRGATTLDLNIWHALKDREKIYSILREQGFVKNFEGDFRCKNGRLLSAIVSAKIITLHDEPHVLAVTLDISELKEAAEATRKLNISLEERVSQRTAELKETNEDLLRQINERRAAELSLQESEKKNATLVEASLTGIHISVAGKIRFANKQFADIFGYDKDELIGMDTLELIHPEDRKLVKAIRQQRLAGKDAPERYEIRGVRKDGEVVQLLRRNTLIDFEGGKALIGNVADITEQKNAEESLKKSERELRVLSAKLLSAEEEERKRISYDIHDSIGQILSAIKFSVENALRTFSETGDGSGIENLQGIVPLTQQAIEEVRRIIMDLRPSTLDDLGISATISWFCREFESMYPQIKVEREITANEDEIPLRLKTTIYRILQEGMNNAAKHSNPQVVYVSLKKKKGRVELHIEDDGQGFPLDKVLGGKSGRRGMGLASMKERTELAGGTYSLHSTEGGGTFIDASWPERKRQRK